MSLLRIAALLLVIFLIFACAEKTVIPEPPAPAPALINEAAASWDRKDYSLSQSLYDELSRKPDLSRTQQILVYQRLGISAFHNQDYETALEAFEHWGQLAPRARLDWQWHDIYSLSLKNTAGDEAYFRYVNSLSRDMAYPFEIRKMAALSLAGFHFEQDRYPEAMSVLENIYSQADTFSRRDGLEQALHEYLKKFTADELKPALPFIDQKKKKSFPLNVFFWSLYSRQLKEDPARWQSLWPMLSTLGRQGGFADQGPYRRQIETWLEKYGTPVREIAVLLPLSGHFSSAGWKILKGIGAAQWEMLLSGDRLKVSVINTGHEGWLEELENMDSVSIVGGPLSGDKWEEITGSGLNRNKVFLTFLPAIDDEGIAGWRFFPSPNDQVRAMLHRAVFDLGFTDFAIFYPEDDFGRAYSSVFWEEAQEMGVRISGLQSYPGDEPARWNSIVSSFLNILSMDSPYKNPSPSFQAVFIPDSLSRVKGIIPQFFYFDQNQLLFMGPMLWSQAYSPETLEQQYFSLAMTTGGWLDNNPSPGSAGLKSMLELTVQGEPDFWVALGYDFVRFASELDTLPEPAQHKQINAQLNRSEFFDWSMAPIYWDDRGKAFQDLYVLQINRDNLTLADMDYFNSLIQIREARKDQWRRMIQQGQ